MPKINKALIAGAGAIGAAIASRIFDVDPDAVALAASGERKQRYLRDGFIVNGKRYDFRLADSTMAEPYDLIILAVKNYDLESAIEEIRPFFGENTTILSLLNGITSEQILRAEFGKDAVPLAFIIGIDALRAGNRIDFPRPGEIRFGDEKNDPDNLRPAIAEIAEFLKSHNVPYSIPGDMVRAMWYKFMMNVGLNQWSAVLRAPYGVFQKNVIARDLVRETMEEVVALGAKLGVAISAADIDSLFAILDTLGAEGKTSMLQDVEAHRKTEVDAFAKVVVDEASRLGIPVPANAMLSRMISCIEQSYADLAL